MTTTLARSLMAGGSLTAVVTIFNELEKAQTWGELATPGHVFGALGALIVAVGAFYHPPPGKAAPPAA